MARTKIEQCPACLVPGEIASVVIRGTEYGMCRECVVLFVCAHARLAAASLPKPSKK
jgi:hypothetical protein